MNILTDIHSHILPQLDDGADSLEMSLEILRGLESLGYKRVWTTPHISYRFPNNRETVLFSRDTMRSVLKQEEIEIELYAAAEYLFDDAFINKISKSGDLLTLPGKHLLIEFLLYSEPVTYFKDILFDLQLKGYTIILAHPERYAFFYSDFTQYEELKRIGLLFQVNLLSFTGYYGKAVRKMAKTLAKKGMIDFLATDIHHPDQIKLLKDKKISKICEKISVKNDLICKKG